MQVTKKDEKFIQAALDAADKSTMLMKHGCVVVECNRIVGVGCNNYRTQFGDGFITKTCSCHAEMQALRSALKAKTKGKSSPVRKRVGQRLLYEKEV